MTASARRAAAPLRTTLAVVLLAGATSARPADDDPVRARIEVILAERSDGAADDEETVARIAALGSTAVAPALAVLTGEIELDEGRPDPAEERILLDACARMSRSTVVATLAGYLTTNPDFPWRVPVLRLLERIAEADEVSLLLAVADDGSEDGPPGAVLHVLRTALIETFHRDGEAYDAVRRAWPRVSEGLTTVVLRSVGHAGDAAGLELLHALLSTPGGPDGLILSQMSRLADDAPYTIALDAAVDVRPYLRSPHEGLRKSALLVLGKLGDDGSAREMIDLLSDDSESVRNNAHWALARATGLALPPDPDAWSTWLHTEQEWLRRDAPRLFRHLGSNDSLRAGSAAKEIAEHSYDRHHLATELAAGLLHRSAKVRLLSCAGLKRLDSPAPLAELVDALEDPSPQVRAAAHGALCSITKESLPLDAEAWVSRAGL